MTPTTDNIIQLLASGYTVKEIAAMLDMKKRTVEKRINTLRRRQQCKTVTELVVKYLRLVTENMQPV